MPHCIIEHSKVLAKHIDFDELVAKVHDDLKQCGLFHEKDIKTRALGYKHCIAGDGTSDFIHVNIKTLPGRPLEIKKQLTKKIHQTLSDIFITGVIITVEITEIEKETYIKILHA